jgi:predicted Zn-dependent peptidase
MRRMIMGDSQRKYFRGIASIGIIFGLVMTALATSDVITPACAYDLEKKVHSYTLENGLKVLIAERHFSPTVSFYIRYKVGAVDESDDQTGAAHLLEHMLFKGTKTIGALDWRREEPILEKIRAIIKDIDRESMKGDRADRQKLESLQQRLSSLQTRARRLFEENEIDRLYTENGGFDMNAFTGYDQTTYFVNLPSNKIELWARIESDRMMNPVFRDYYSERNVIIEERKQTVGSRPSRQLMEDFLATAFMVHPYRRPILGWESEMRFLDIDAVRKFFTTYHGPNNTVIAVAGDVNPDEVMRIIGKYFGSIPRQELPQRHIPTEPTQTGERRIELISDSNPELIIGYHKPTLPSFDDYVFDLIDMILSRGRTSRLHASLVEGKEIATEVTTANGFPAARYPNLFVFFVTPRHPHTNGECEKAVYEEIDRLQNEPVQEEEIRKAKNQLKADFFRKLDSNGGLASMLSYYESIAGDYRYINNYLASIERISAGDIMKAANTYFIPENRTVARLVTKSEPSLRPAEDKE